MARVGLSDPVQALFASARRDSRSVARPPARPTLAAGLSPLEPPVLGMFSVRSQRLA